MAEERNYYCICDDNCKFPTMTEEQILEAISEATGNTPTRVDDAFISKLKEMNVGGNFTVWVGTTAEYNALESIEQNRLYILTDEAWGDDIEAFVTELNAKVDALTANKNLLLCVSEIPAGTSLSVSILDKVKDCSIVKVTGQNAENLCNVQQVSANELRIFGGGGASYDASYYDTAFHIINLTVNTNTNKVTSNLSKIVALRSGAVTYQELRITKIMGVM